MLIRNGLIVLFLIIFSGCGGGGGGGGDTTPPDDNSVTYTVSASATSGGSITPSSVQVSSGETATFTVTSDSGFIVESVTGCGGSLTGDTFVTALVEADCSISADFVEESVVIVDDNAPEASISFPWNNSRTNDNQITIRGTATDSNEIQAIRVNGVLATTELRTAVGGSFKNRNSGTSVSDIYHWEATINVPVNGDLTVIVETEDEFGNIDIDAASLDVLAQDIPTNFTIDKLNNRLIGQIGNNELVTFDLATSDVESIQLNGLNANDNFVYMEGQDKVLYSSLFDNDLTLYTVTLATGDVDELVNHDLNLDPDVWSFAHVKALEFAQEEAVAYISLKYFSATGGSAKTVILKFDPMSLNFETIADGKTATDKTITTDDIAYTTDGLILFDNYWASGSDNISRLDLNGEDVAPFATVPYLLASNIDIDRDESYAYLTGYDGITKVDLSDGSNTVLSLDEDLEELNISQIRSSGIDSAHNRLLVADSDLDIIMSVDLDSGARTNFVSNGVGEGRVLVAPREFALDSENNIAYVADDGSNRPELLFTIDLATGDRTTLADINQEFNVYINGIVLDAEAQQLYVQFADKILRVDIQTESVEEISSESVGTGVSIGAYTGMALDIENNRLVVADAPNASLLSVDLDNGDRTLLSKEGSKGEGDALEGATDVELDLSNNIAYVLSQRLGALIKVDLETGDRELLLDSCKDANGNEKFPEDSGSVQNLDFVASKNQILVTAETILTYDVESNTCYAPSSFVSLFDVATTDNGNVIGSYFNKLYLIDPESGEKVIISK